MRKRLQNRFPSFRKFGPIWKAAEVIDTLDGWWGRMPGPAKHAVTFALSWLLSGSGVAIVAWLRDISRTYWPVMVVLAFAIGLGVWAIGEILVTERMRRAMSSVTHTFVKTTAAPGRIAEGPAADARAREIGTLTVFMNEGFNLRDKIRGLVDKWDEKYANRARAWEQRVLTYLDRQLPAYSGTFRRDDVVQQWQPGACFEVATWGNFMDRRLAAIDRVVSELRGLGETARPAASSPVPRWTGVDAPPPKGPDRVGMPAIILGPPPDNAAARVRPDYDQRWAWLRVTNNEEPSELEMQLEWMETGHREHPYIAPWREGNKATLLVSRGRTAVINVAEVIDFIGEYARLRFFSTASDDGCFYADVRIHSQVRVRASVIRGSLPPVHAGDFTLTVRSTGLHFDVSQKLLSQ
jgi:hypothetical protein